MKLTIGMPSYKNTSEVWFTLQALRMYHDLSDTELLVIDNFGSKDLKNKMSWMIDVARLVEFTDIQSPAHAKNKVFEEAKGEWVICIDSHILLIKDSVAKFKEWTDNHQGCSDLLQGPLLYDNLKQRADHFTDVWSGHMWGQWGDTGNKSKEAYEIKMMGCGFLACRKDAWLGFSDKFKGFGAEEGYIHEKFRQSGRKVLSLPFMQWVHYFSTFGGECIAPYSPTVNDRIHNYIVGFKEVGLSLTPIKEHFNLTDEQLNNY